MKKKNSRKIALNRETLRHLDTSTLANVGGAATNGPGPRCNSGTCENTWSECYITACNCDPSIVYYCPI